jgi:hypothetical protein
MERVVQKRHGPVSRVTPEMQQELREQLRVRPDLTLWELQRAVQKQRQTLLSKSTLGLWLQRMGLRRKNNRSTPKSKIPRKDDGGGKRGGDAKRHGKFRRRRGAGPHWLHRGLDGKLSDSTRDHRRGMPSPAAWHGCWESAVWSR